MPSRRMHGGRVLAALALLAALDGCVAAVAAIAVPAATGVGIRQESEAERASRDPARGTAAADAGPAELALAGPALPGAAPGSSPAEPVLEITDLTELPAPSYAMGPAPAMGPATAGWQGFFEFALAAAALRTSGTAANSAVLNPTTSPNGLHQVEPCEGGESAVLLDIDPGSEAFNLLAGPQALPGLAEGLADLRASGIVVMWISQLRADQVSPLADALRQSGLDPHGRDPILLAFRPGERKQVIRANASETVCVLAIAGDRMGDFDELFDYLRNPLDAQNFSELVGAGWFLLPPPLGANGGDAIKGAFKPAAGTSGQISP